VILSTFNVEVLLQSQASMTANMNVQSKPLSQGLKAGRTARLQKKPNGK
jgi:hypothetical protein